MNPAEPIKTASKCARLRVECDGHFGNLHVFAVPIDGTEEFELKVNSALVESRTGEPVMAEIRAYAADVQLRDLEGRTVKAHSSNYPSFPAVYPNVEIEPSDGRIQGFRYAVDGRAHIARLELEQRQPPSRPSPLRRLLHARRA